MASEWTGSHQDLGLMCGHFIVRLLSKSGDFFPVRLRQLRLQFPKILGFDRITLASFQLLLSRTFERSETFALACCPSIHVHCNENPPNRGIWHLTPFVSIHSSPVWVSKIWRSDANEFQLRELHPNPFMTPLRKWVPANVPNQWYHPFSTRRNKAIAVG